MDLALPFELLLVLVFLRQRVFHLLEAHVVHARGVDMAANKRRLRRPRQAHGHLDGRIGMVRVIKGDVDLPVHQLSLHTAPAEA